MPSKKYITRQMSQDIQTISNSVNTLEKQEASPKNLLIYYGYLNSFNSAQNAWYNEAVAQDFAKYDLIVFGDTIQSPTHPDYANTQIIIPRIKVLNPKCLIFGYVIANQILVNFQTKVVQWNTLQVDGIFMDESGYDYTVTRAQFNTMLDYVHSRAYSKLAFANAWNTDHLLGIANDVSYPNSTYNPTLVSSHLRSTDWVLLESFAINTASYSGSGGYETKTNWYARGVKAVSLRCLYPINVAGGGIISNASVVGQELANFGYLSSLMWSLDAWGTSDENYGSGASVNRWKRLKLNTEACWSLSPSVINDATNTNLYHRVTDRFEFVLDFTASAQTWKINYKEVAQAIAVSTISSTATGAGFQILKTMTVPAYTLVDNRILRLQAGVRRTTGSANGIFRLCWNGTSVVALAATGNTPIVLCGHIYLANANVSGYLWHDADRAYGSGGALSTNKDQAFTLQVDLATDSDVFTCDWVTVELISKI